MKIDEIKARHDTLEAIKDTQSVKQITEKRSQAHRDRGYLLSVIEKLVTELESKNGESPRIKR